MSLHHLSTDYRWNDEAEQWETLDGSSWVPSVPMDGYGEEDGIAHISRANWTTIHERVMSERDRKREEDGPNDCYPMLTVFNDGRIVQ
jgi:hypothetical protein